MSQHNTHVGIDISKNSFDIAVHETSVHKKCQMILKDIKPIVNWIKKQKPNLIVLEATGGYERTLVAELVQAKLPVAIINPRMIRDFAKSLGKLAKTDKITIGLVEIGAQSTTCSIVDSGILKSSHSLNVAGNEMTQSLATTFSLRYKEAEELKKKYGISPLSKEVPEQEGSKAAEVILSSVDSILVEVQRIFNSFSRNEKKEVQRVILAGGSAQLPGLQEYFSSVLKKEVEIINPFVNIFYPPILEETLKEISPGYAIALGAALRGLE